MNTILDSLFNNPKTTVSAVVGAAVFLCAKFGFDVPNEVQIGIIAVTCWVIGFFSSDAK
jgi:hypothetical protein